MGRSARAVDDMKQQNLEEFGLKIKKYRKEAGIPNMDEQEEIVNYIAEKEKEIDILIENKSNMLSSLNSYKKSLIYEYVTGKKEVPA